MASAVDVQTLCQRAIVLHLGAAALLDWFSGGPVLRAIGQRDNIADDAGEVFDRTLIPQLYASFAISFLMQKFLLQAQNVIVNPLAYSISVGVFLLHTLLTWLSVYVLEYGLIGAALALSFSWWLLFILQGLLPEVCPIKVAKVPESLKIRHIDMKFVLFVCLSLTGTVSAQYDVPSGTSPQKEGYPIKELFLILFVIAVVVVPLIYCLKKTCGHPNFCGSVDVEMAVREYVLCVICQENILDDQVKRTLPECNHTYHEDCIRRWAEPTCPLCRRISEPAPGD